MNLLDLKEIGVKSIVVFLYMNQKTAYLLPRVSILSFRFHHKSISKFMEPETRRNRYVAILFQYFVNANSTIWLIFSIDHHKKSRIFTIFTSLFESSSVQLKSNVGLAIQKCSNSETTIKEVSVTYHL